jgi:hypothetical protein
MNPFGAVLLASFYLSRFFLDVPGVLFTDVFVRPIFFFLFYRLFIPFSSVVIFIKVYWLYFLLSRPKCNRVV